jgi:hypothetical protein
MGLYILSHCSSKGSKCQVVMLIFSKDVIESPDFEEYRKCLGPDMFGARYLGKPVSLATIGNWLLHLIGENPAKPVPRLDFLRHGTVYS